MTKAITITYTVLHRYRERLFAILLAAILITLASYVFLIHKAVVNIVARETTVEKISAKSSKVAELEGKYFTIKNSITLEVAHQKGFKDVSISNYISKKSVTAMASQHEL